jgi:hypothetical protein
MPAHEFRGARRIGALGWGLTLVAIVALIAISLAERAHRVETPRWNEARFVALRSGEPNAASAFGSCCAPAPRESVHVASVSAPGAAPEFWLVAVNPGCPPCRASLARVTDRAAPIGTRVRVAALLVDAPVRPDSAALVGLAAQDIYWDSSGVWKHRWGRHAYGETMVFDSAGTLLRIVPIEP